MLSLYFFSLLHLLPLTIYVFKKFLRKSKLLLSLEEESMLFNFHYKNKESSSWIYCIAECVCLFCPWCHKGQKVGSCGWQVETGCLQWGVRTLSVVQLNWVILSSQWHLRKPAMGTGCTGNGGTEAPHPGLGCTGCSDKTTGRGRFEQGNMGSKSWLPLLRKNSLIPQITCHTCGGQCLNHTVPPVRSLELVTKASD